MTDMLAPVVVFAYNRPVHLRRTLDALAACRLADRTIVHVFADGPRKPEVADAVDAVRDVLTQEAIAGRFAAFHIHASPVNLGLANSIIRGVGQVLAERGRAIVLEDDLLMSADFLEFMNDCLDFYADDASVGAISGFSPLNELPASCRDDVYITFRNCSHGWATWSRVWTSVDWTAAGAASLASDLGLRRAFNREGNDRYDRLRRQLAGRIDSWSIRFGLSLFLSGLATVYPAVNRVRNIGFDGSGIHCGTDETKNDVLSEGAYQLKSLRLNPQIQDAFRAIYSGSFRGRLSREILVLWPRLAGWLGR